MHWRPDKLGPAESCLRECRPPDLRAAAEGGPDFDALDGDHCFYLVLIFPPIDLEVVAHSAPLTEKGRILLLSASYYGEELGKGSGCDRKGKHLRRLSTKMPMYSCRMKK